MSVGLYLSFDQNGDLDAWQEGRCTHCLEDLLSPVPDVTVVMDEWSTDMLAN